MPFAVNLLLDSELTRTIRGFWARLAERRLSETMERLAHPPHVTLGIYETLDVAQSVPALTAFAAEQAMIPVTLPGLGIFPGPASVLWAVVTPNEPLVTCQRRLHRADLAVAREHYRPSQWVPHCTLAMDLEPRALQQALCLLSGHWQPLAGSAITLDLTEIPPDSATVRSLWQTPLG